MLRQTKNLKSWLWYWLKVKSKAKTSSTYLNIKTTSQNRKSASQNRKNTYPNSKSTSSNTKSTFLNSSYGTRDSIGGGSWWKVCLMLLIVRVIKDCNGRVFAIPQEKGCLTEEAAQRTRTQWRRNLRLYHRTRKRISRETPSLRKRTADWAWNYQK